MIRVPPTYSDKKDTIKDIPEKSRSN